MKVKIAITAIITFILLEAITRLFSVAILHTNTPEKTEDPVDLIESYPHSGIIFSLKSNLEIEFRGKKFTTNSEGFRNREVYEKMANTFRVVGIGDSVLMGWGVGDDETYFSVAERSLSHSITGDDVEIEFINLGVMGYNTTQEYFTLKDRGLKYKPDLLIAHYTGNDLEPIKYPFVSVPWLTPFYFFNVVQLAWDQISSGESEINNWRPIKQPYFEDNFFWSLSKIFELSNKENFPVLMVLGSRYVGQGVKHSEIVEFSKAQGIESINLYEIMRDIPESTPLLEAVSIKDYHNLNYLIEMGIGNDGHPNQFWHEEVARIISEKVMPYIELKKSL